MQSLSEVVRALRTEVATALAEGGALPDGCRLVADRVVATLGFAVVSGPDDAASRRPPRFVVSGESVPAHSLRVEFAVRGGGASSPPVGASVDEVSFWNDDDSANPDHEVLIALRAAMASVPEAMLVAVTTTYAKRCEVGRIYD